MSTRHLDTAIAILGGGKKRRQTPGRVIHLTDLGSAGVSVQVGRKEVWLAPDMPAARVDAQQRAARIAALTGSTPPIIEE